MTHDQAETLYRNLEHLGRRFAPGSSGPSDVALAINMIASFTVRAPEVWGVVARRLHDDAAQASRERGKGDPGPPIDRMVDLFLNTEIGGPLDEHDATR